MWLTIMFQTVVIVACVIGLTRLHGVRSFSKMSGFDFAITVAFGSVIASTVMSPDEGITVGIVALASLFAVQIALSRGRLNGLFGGALDNQPIMIMRGSEILDDNLAAAGMTRDDLFSKLREANAWDFTRVHCVVAEATGDVSVLHEPGGTGEPDPRLIDGVRGA